MFAVAGYQPDISKEYLNETTTFCTTVSVALFGHSCHKRSDRLSILVGIFRLCSTGRQLSNGGKAT